MPAIASRDPFVMVPGGPSVPWPPEDGGFTESAKRALGFAQDVAATSGHNHVGPAHILVGLAHEPEGLVSRVFADLGITHERMRSAFASAMGRSETPMAPSDITLIPSARNVLDWARYESRRLAHTGVGTEHLLLALVRREQDIHSTILASLGIDRDELRTRILALMRVPPSYGAAEHATPSEGPYELFDAAARRALLFAQEEAVNAGDRGVGGEHIVLGLARVADTAGPDDTIRVVFGELGLSLEALRTEFVKIQPPGRGKRATREVTFTPSVKLVIELAMQAAGPGRTVRPEHILLAIGRAQDSLGGYLLAQLGATPERVRAAKRATNDRISLD